MGATTSAARCARRSTSRRLAVALVAGVALVAVPLAGCSDAERSAPTGSGDTHAEHRHGEPADAEKISVQVPGGDGEYTFETSVEEIEEGPVELALTNMGAEEHQASIVRMPDGMTFEDLVALAVQDPTGKSVFDAIEGFGGPNGAAPGETVSSTQYLLPGDYLLVCFIPGADGIPHAMKGMVRPFTVVPKSGAPREPEVSDADVTLLDFAFVVPERVDAGQRISVRNDGQQAHELGIAKLHDGQSVEEALAAIEAPGEGGEPPVGDGGLGPVRPGQTVWTDVPDEPGRYLFFCMLPDTASDGKPHVMAGMTREVTVS